MKHHLICETWFVEMPQSLKQLDQRYENVCNNLKDAKDYTLQHLQTNIVMDLQAFYKDLGITNLEECKAKLDVIEETVQQCRVAIKNENSRRFLQDQIVKMTEKQSKKTLQKHSFKRNRRGSRLRKATPYTLQESQSIGE